MLTQASELTQLERKILTTIKNHISTHNIAPTIAEIASALDINSRGTVHRYVQSLIKKGALERIGKGWRGLRLTSMSDAAMSRSRATTIYATGRESANPILTPIPASGGSMSPPESHESADIHEGKPLSLGVNADNLEVSDLQLTTSAQYDSDQLKIPFMGAIAAGVPIEAIPDQQYLDLAAFLIGPERYALRVTGESMIDAGILDGDTVILQKTTQAKTGDIVVALIDNQEATLKRLGKTQDGLIELIPENSSMPMMLYSSKRVSIQGVLVGQLRSY